MTWRFLFFLCAAGAFGVKLAAFFSFLAQNLHLIKIVANFSTAKQGVSLSDPACHTGMYAYERND